MDDYPWPRLSPLPEALVAAMTLRELPPVDARIPTGWAPAALTLVTAVLANRPGTQIRLRQNDGHLGWTLSGGTLNDPSAEIHEPLFGWLVGDIAEKICAVCGRPGRRRTEHAGVWCDSCWRLRLGDTDTPEPRLPLLDDAAEALRELPAIESLPAIPAGWAPLVRSVLKRLGDGSGRDVTFRDRGGYLTVLVGGEPGGLEFQVRTTLEALSRERCRFCGRHVEEDSPHSAECDGCSWVRSQGWEILPAFADDGGPS